MFGNLDKLQHSFPLHNPHGNRFIRSLRPASVIVRVAASDSPMEISSAEVSDRHRPLRESLSFLKASGTLQQCPRELPGLCSCATSTAQNLPVRELCSFCEKGNCGKIIQEFRNRLVRKPSSPEHMASGQHTRNHKTHEKPYMS